MIRWLLDISPKEVFYVLWLVTLKKSHLLI